MISAAAADAVAAAAADNDDAVVAALDATAAVVILDWKCPAKNKRAKNAAVAPSFALPAEADDAILS